MISPRHLPWNYFQLCIVSLGSQWPSSLELCDMVVILCLRWVHRRTWLKVEYTARQKKFRWLWYGVVVVCTEQANGRKPKMMITNESLDVHCHWNGTYLLFIKNWIALDASPTSTQCVQWMNVVNYSNTFHGVTQDIFSRLPSWYLLMSYSFYLHFISD